MPPEFKDARKWDYSKFTRGVREEENRYMLVSRVCAADDQGQ